MSRRSRGVHLDKQGVALAVLVVVVVAGAIFALNSVPSGAERASDSKYVSHYQQIVKEGQEPAPKLIGFLGDSWSCGGGLPSNVGPEGSFAAQTADRLGWPHEIDCAGGTGYTTATATDYLSRLPALIRAKPDVVILQGSTNDYQASEAEIQRAADRVVTRVQAALPDAQVFILGPAYTPDSPPAVIDQGRRALEAVAAAHHVTWIDLARRGWLNLSSDFADGYHPDAGGHRKLAIELAKVVSAAQ